MPVASFYFIETILAEFDIFMNIISHNTHKRNSCKVTFEIIQVLVFICCHLFLLFSYEHVAKTPVAQELNK